LSKDTSYLIFVVRI